MSQLVRVVIDKQTSEPLLNALMALIEGYKWTRNACKRTADSGFLPPDYQPRYPIGSLCLSSPIKSKDLSVDEENWDGWLKPKGGESVAPAAFSELPRYCSRWSDGGPLLQKYGVRVQPAFCPEELVVIMAPSSRQCWPY